jgi:hypothetical protein
MRRAVQTLVLSLALMLGAGLAARAAEEMDLLLVLASDVSRSIDEPKFQLQRDGYVAAMSDPRVLEAIKAGKNHRIAICFVEWSGVLSQKLVIDWTIVQDAASARTFGDKLTEAPRAFAERTAIGSGIDFAVQQLDRAPFTSTRRTIDVSGDGTNNSGRDVREARDDANAKDITVNGLVILSERPMSWNPDHTHPPGGLANYYRDNVIGGPGAFVMVAQNFESFGKAILNKLIAEIAQARAPMQHASVLKVSR